MSEFYVAKERWIIFLIQRTISVITEFRKRFRIKGNCSYFENFWNFETLLKFWNSFEILKLFWNFDTLLKFWNSFEILKLFWNFENFWNFETLAPVLVSIFRSLKKGKFLTRWQNQQGSKENIDNSIKRVSNDIKFMQKLEYGLTTKKLIK